MKRYLLIIIPVFLFVSTTFANHITGGEMYYTFTGFSGSNYQYHVTLKLYRDCFAPPGSAQLDPTASIAIFDKSSGSMIWSNTAVPRSQFITLNLNSPNPCINNPPAVCYEVGYYEFDVTLPGSSNGYVIAYQRCCRILGINNLSGSNSVGATYTADIPGTLQLATAPMNNSARFIGPDTVIVCANNPFTYSFAATDGDGDRLDYSFCDAYTGGTTSQPAPSPPSAPPYMLVPYALPFFNGSSPLGPAISINPVTGLITGTAPAAGIYVVTVCVTETRNGIVIATQRKDLQIKIGDCTLAKATLDPQYITCDGFSMTFQNQTSSPLINSYFWDFGVLSATNDTSNVAIPTFNFPDTGVYTVKLVTNRNQPCSDSTTTIVKVYPGFFPGFIVTGSCLTNPFIFTDTTNTRYGFVNSWSWNFGDQGTLADTSHINNPPPQWTYPTSGPRTAQLIVTNSKGCIDTTSVVVNVLDKPPLSVAFRDTLICRNDVIQLSATGTGQFNWTGGGIVNGANTATPTVAPTATTWYYVNLIDNGCFNRDSVRVRVVAAVSLLARADTTICQGDQVQLNAVSDGLTYSWSPTTGLSNPNIINPVATVNATTTYTLSAFVGSCRANDQVTINTVPYPVANAGPNLTACFNGSVQLNASHDGSLFTWTPINYLNNPNILNPVATPPRTTQYIFSSFDTRGCPKPGRDTVIVTVLPRVRAYAGRDTSVVIGQPLQFNGSGGVTYVWSPTTGLSNPNIFNPIGVYTAANDTIKYKLVVADVAGCQDSAFMTVRIFQTKATIFVPTAFTPNNDGRNDVVRPICVGIQKINYFSVYNRWGQLVFTTTVDRAGWDGRIDGRLQNTDVFVWMVSAVDFQGTKVFKKGTVALIR